MGYSCSAIADEVLQALSKLIQDSYPESERLNLPSNSLPVSSQAPLAGFFEVGRENRDGSITGSVFRHTDGSYIRLGSFKIAANGRIVRFPGLTPDLKRAAQSMGIYRFARLHSLPVNMTFEVLP